MHLSIIEQCSETIGNGCKLLSIVFQRASVSFTPGADDVFYGMRVWAEEMWLRQADAPFPLTPAWNSPCCAMVWCLSTINICSLVSCCSGSQAMATSSLTKVSERWVDCSARRGMRRAEECALPLYSSLHFSESLELFLEISNVLY